MKAFLIVCAVLLAIFVLLCTNIVFKISIGEDGIYKHKIRWLFISLHSMPEAKKSRKFSEKSNTTPKKKKEIQKKNKPKFKLAGINEIKNFINNLVTFLQEVFGGLIGTIRVKKLHLKIAVAGEDSAETAVQYGRLSAVCSNTLYRLENSISLKDTFVYVEPDFFSAKTKIYLDAKIKIRIISVLAVLFKNLFKGLSIYEQAMQIFFVNESADTEKGKDTK